MFTFSKTRLEAFSDGVIAIIITIMVLEIPLPKTFALPEILGLLRSILIFFVSFFIVGSHWVRHHSLSENLEKVTHMTLWRNLLYLFCLALVPIFTKWFMEFPDEVAPAVGYNIVFVLVMLCDRFLWAQVINQPGKKELAQKLAKIQKRSLNRWVEIGMFVLAALVIAGLFALSIFNPRLSAIFFIGFPVCFSLLNLFTDRNSERDIVGAINRP